MMKVALLPEPKPVAPAPKPVKVFVEKQIPQDQLWKRYAKSRPGGKVENQIVQIQKYNGNPFGLQFPAHVELTVTSTEASSTGDTVSGSVTKVAVLETGLEIRVPRFVKEGDKIKVHTETKDFAGRA